jgi:DNA-binding response OmpR family regulator
MKALMIMEGHEPVVVNDSTKTMDVVSSFMPDLITLDVMMPGISGFDLCEHLRRDSRFANIPILIVSARDDPASRDRALRAGAKDYLTKPFNVNGLLEKISALTK